MKTWEEPNQVFTPRIWAEGLGFDFAIGKWAFTHTGILRAVAFNSDN